MFYKVFLEWKSEVIAEWKCVMDDPSQPPYSALIFGRGRTKELLRVRKALS